MEPWTIRYLIVDTSNWWAGKNVRVARGCITDVSWNDSKVYTTLTRLERDAPSAHAPDRTPHILSIALSIGDTP